MRTLSNPRICISGADGRGSYSALRCHPLPGDLSRFCGIPEFIVDNPQFWHFLNDPLSRRIWPRLALTRLGVLDELLPVPDEPTDIHFVVQDAIAALGIAVDCAEAPIATAWR
jgi:hypothetical protein